MKYCKVITLLNKRADMSQADFSDHWRTVHKDLALQLVTAGYIQGYLQNHSLEVELEGWKSIANGAPELWIHSPSDMQQMLESAEYQQGAKPDEENFIAPPYRFLIAEEHVLVEPQVSLPEHEMVKVMFFIQRAVGQSLVAFTDAWLRNKVPFLMPEAKPYRLSRHVSLADTASNFDGVETSWWPSFAAFKQQWANRETASDYNMPKTVEGLIVSEEWVVRPECDSLKSPSDVS